MKPAEAEREAERQRSKAGLRQAVEKILRRNRGVDPEYVSMEIVGGIVGLGWEPPTTRPEYCPNHPSIRTPCGLCLPPLPFGDDDDD